jgi:hypothetical protein
MLVLEEIAPEDKNRKEVLRMRVQIYVVAKKLAGAPRTLCIAVVSSRCVAPNQQPESWPSYSQPDRLNPNHSPPHSMA